MIVARTGSRHVSGHSGAPFARQGEEHGTLRVQREPLNASVLRRALVAQLKDSGFIHSEGVEAAFRAVPRHIFVPGVPLDTAYSDVYVPTVERDGIVISSSSQPALMAGMLEMLDLRPGQQALEVGAGTGYNAALMAHIVGQAGSVVTIDLDDDIVAGARAHLAAAGYGQVHVERGNGEAGYAAAAPYDRIIVTAAARDVAPAWREQLAPGGRLVLPLALTPLVGRELLVAFDRADGYLESAAVTYCGFMPMRGAFSAAPADHVRPGAVTDLDLNYAAERLRIRAYAREAGYVAAEHETVIDKPWSRLVLRHAGVV